MCINCGVDTGHLGGATPKCDVCGAAKYCSQQCKVRPRQAAYWLHCSCSECALCQLTSRHELHGSGMPTPLMYVTCCGCILRSCHLYGFSSTYPQEANSSIHTSFCPVCCELTEVYNIDFERFIQFVPFRL